MHNAPTSRTCSGEGVRHQVGKVSALWQKLGRELWQHKGQMASIAMVVATGIMTVMTMRGSYDSLVAARQSYYRQARFADVWAPLKRAPDSVRRTLQQIPGVAAVDTRVTFLATLDIPGLDAPAQGRLVSLPEHGRPLLNDIRLRRGRYLAPGASSEVLISDKFAAAHHYQPGDSLQAVINGRARRLRIVGIAISPEYTYTVPPGALLPDNLRFGILWMSRKVLGPAYDMDGAFNQAVLSLSPDADPRAVLARVDQVLDRYGGLGAYLRKDQPSNQILQSELDSNKVMGTAIPAVFLAVAAFLLNLVLSRLITTQRTTIAVLKAFGYRNREIGLHYLLFAMSAVLVGTVIGTLSGVALGHAYVTMYGAYFDFPSLDYQFSPVLLAVAVLVSVLAAGGGAMLAVRRALRLPPAEAMRPEPPAQFKAGWMERSGLLEQLPSAARMIARNLQRKPWQALLSSLGVAFSVAILIIGLFMFDGMKLMMNLQFQKVQREDLSVTFNEPHAASVRYDFAHMRGVTRVEPFRVAHARLRFGHLQKETAIQGLQPDGRLRRIVNDLLGVSAYMTLPALQRVVGGAPMLSGAYLSVNHDALPALKRALKQVPAIAGVSSPTTMHASFQKQLAESLYIGVGFLLGFAGVIAVAVIYNGARIALSERGRELASLRVMGFRRSEVSVLLLGEQALITLLAIPIGCVLGYWLALLVSNAMQSDTYRIPFLPGTGTWLSDLGVRDTSGNDLTRVASAPATGQ